MVKNKVFLRAISVILSAVILAGAGSLSGCSAFINDNAGSEADGGNLPIEEENKQDNEILRLKAKNVTLPLSEEDLETLSLIKEYLDNSYNKEAIEKYALRPGVGLAAPQIGVSKKIFGIKAYDENKVLHEYYVINPKIISESVETTYLSTGEGCLSVDRDVQGLIFRPKKITVRTNLYDFETNELKQVILKLKDYIAIEILDI